MTKEKLEERRLAEKRRGVSVNLPQFDKVATPKKIEFNASGPIRGVRDALWDRPVDAPPIWDEIKNDGKQIWEDVKVIKDVLTDDMEETVHGDFKYGADDWFIAKEGVNWDAEAEGDYFAYGEDGKMKHFDKGQWRGPDGEIIYDPTYEDLFQMEELGTEKLNPWMNKDPDGTFSWTDENGKFNPLQPLNTDRSKIAGLAGLFFIPGVGDAAAWHMDGQFFDEKEQEVDGYWDENDQWVSITEPYNPRTAGNALFSGLSYGPMLGMSAKQIKYLKGIAAKRKARKAGKLKDAPKGRRVSRKKKWMRRGAIGVGLGGLTQGHKMYKEEQKRNDGR
jgi:hypothetical protein